MGTLKVEVIPYRTFKEKIQITRQLRGQLIEIEKNYIIIYHRGGANNVR